MGVIGIYVIGGGTVPDIPGTGTQKWILSFSRSKDCNHSMIITFYQYFLSMPEATK